MPMPSALSKELDRSPLIGPLPQLDGRNGVLGSERGLLR